MEDTATPETGPVDAPESDLDAVMAEFYEGEEGGGDDLDAVTEELVNEAEGDSDSEQEPETEDDATEPVEDEAEEPEEGTPDQQTYTVKVNGEERQVPLDELLKGYSRTEDYKAKTATVAEERRTLEAERQRVEADVSAKYANQLEEATNLFAQFDPILQEAQRIDWDALKKSDPAAFVNAQDAVKARLSAIDQMNARAQEARQQAEKQQQAQAAEERAKRFDTAADEIVKAMPELADEAKFQEFAGSNVEYLKGLGFQGDEIAEVLDHRVLTLADKARKWDAQEAAKQSLPEKRVVKTSKVKPTTTDGAGSRATKPRMPNTGSREALSRWAANQILEDM